MYRVCSYSGFVLVVKGPFWARDSPWWIAASRESLGGSVQAGNGQSVRHPVAGAAIARARGGRGGREDRRGHRQCAGRPGPGLAGAGPSSGGGGEALAAAKGAVVGLRVADLTDTRRPPAPAWGQFVYLDRRAEGDVVAPSPNDDAAVEGGVGRMAWGLACAAAGEQFAITVENAGKNTVSSTVIAVCFRDW